MILERVLLSWWRGRTVVPRPLERLTRWAAGTDLGAGTAAPPADAAAGDPGALAAEPMSSAGLPPLASVPGALLIGGLVLATGVGWWLQKIGGFVLGGAGSCAHGLETGIPDLRKA